MSTQTIATTGKQQRQLSTNQSEREAQELFYRLEGLLIEETPMERRKEDIHQALEKTQNLMKEMTNRTQLGSEMSNTLEDMSELLFSARQMGRNKDFADQLQHLSLEAQKALRSGHAVDISDTNKEATAFINLWRPVFYLLMNSRQFRELLLDAIRIAWRVVYMYEDFNIHIDKRPKSGEEAIADRITKERIEDIKVNGPPQMNDQEWRYLQKDVKKVWLLLAREPSFRKGVERIFSLLDIFQNSIDLNLPTGILSENVHSRKVTESDDAVPIFSGRETLEEFKYHLRNLIIKFNENESLRAYLTQLKHFILKPRSEDIIYSKEFKEKSKELACNGRLAMKKWINEIQLKPFLKSAYDMIENIKNEEFLQLLRHHAGIVKSDLSYIDSAGIVQVDTHLLSRLQSSLLPILTDTLKSISLPPIQSNNDNREYLLDKLLLCCRNIKPENIRFHLESEVTLSDIQLEGTHNYFVIELDQLFAELKDIDFFYRKKTFPEQTDHGRVTFRGKDAKLIITYNFAQDLEDKTIRIMEGFVSFHISDMDIEFDKSTMKQDIWISRLKKIFQTQVIKQIERQVETNLNGFMIRLGDVLMNTIASSNRPCLSGIEAARQAVKTARIFDKRPEKAIE